jgi:hypothetical protein
MGPVGDLSIEATMSALGQKQTLDWRPLMSALPPKADIAERDWDVRFVPKADIDSQTISATTPLISLRYAV